ncbi:MAG: hypothetical protein EBE86_003645 [Hormoscilla sp. GUM202]|nr:hypothetical protein [Hormoscilla sp. GUM202]
MTQKRSGLFCTSRLVEYAIIIPLDSSWEAKMTANFPNIDLSGVQPDLQTLKSFEQLLDYIESRIDPSQEPAAIASLCKLKKEIIKLKSKKKPGDRMLHAGVSELRKSFYAHKDAIRERKSISYTNLQLLHDYCHHKKSAADGSHEGRTRIRDIEAEEPDEAKVSRPVLETSRSGDGLA